MVRLFLIFLALALLVLIPFAIWGEGLERLFSLEQSIVWLGDYGQWAWAAGMLVLASDLLLPIPATAVMAALGYVYGPLWGGLISTAGGFLGACWAMHCVAASVGRWRVVCSERETSSRASACSPAPAAGWWCCRVGSPSFPR